MSKGDLLMRMSSSLIRSENDLGKIPVTNNKDLRIGDSAQRIAPVGMESIAYDLASFCEDQYFFNIDRNVLIGKSYDVVQ